ncbi:MAG: bifunctional riboflavin kinase/FMN adenylyltransferase [bacterium]
MRTIIGIDDIPNAYRNSVVALGSFDGVHLGHQEVIKRAVSIARGLGCASVVLTFDRLPMSLIAPEKKPHILTTAEEKGEAIARLGTDAVICVRFDETFARKSPDEFIKGILVDVLGAKHVVVGYNYFFGKDRAGDVGLLEDRGRMYGFDTDVIPPVMVDGVEVSSTIIRNLLESGDVSGANRMLGREYSIAGLSARQKGTDEFPWEFIPANPEKLIPGSGIYAGRLDLQRGDPKGVTVRITSDFVRRKIELKTDYPEKRGIISFIERMDAESFTISTDAVENFSAPGNPSGSGRKGGDLAQCWNNPRNRR